MLADRDLGERIAAQILRKQQLVATLAGDADLMLRLQALRAWQSARLAATYADLRADPRHQPAIEFFLDELYGTHDFAPRDRELHRAWRILEKTLPAPAMRVLGDALDLELLSLELDCAVARALRTAVIDADSYAAAYRVTNRQVDRARQLELIVSLARRLADVVAHPWIGRLLRIARPAALAAGFGVLQDFLERGFRAFQTLGDATTFVDAIEKRERLLSQRLFGAQPAVSSTTMSQVKT